MKILLVSSKYMPEYSGSGFRAHNLYKRLLQKLPDINLTVLAGSETENSSASYEYEGFTVNRIADKPYPAVDNRVFRKFQIARNFYSEYTATQIYLKTLEKRPDLIHIFGQNYVSASVLNYAKNNNIPVLIELCNEMDNPHHYIPFPFKLWITGNPPRKYSFICISERLKNMCLKNRIPVKNIWCRPNPINEELFKPVATSAKIDLRNELTKFSGNSKLLVYIAKFIERKNHRFLLDVMPHLPDEFKLFLGGPLVQSGPNQADDTALFEEIRKRLVSEKLTERVQVESGFCKEVEKYYQMADIYLFPTKAEGLGTPMLEAVACGVPVIANRICGITDTWVHDGENGYISELDPKEFAGKILRAAEITHADMLKESEKIVSAAGTETIDRQYLELMGKAVGDGNR